MPTATRTLLAPLALLAALALAACSGSSEGTPTAEAPSATATATPEVTATSEATSTATPEPTATQAPAVELVDGIPVGAVGPLAIYVRPNLVGGVSTPTSRTLVNVVDLGAARIVSSWGFGGFGVRTSVLGISGTGLVVRKSAFTSEIDGGLFLYDLAGVELRRLYEDAGGSTLLDAQLSHDGSTLAVAQTSASCDNVCTILLDVASGEELQVVPQSAAGLAELGGQFPDPIAWRSDGSGVLVGPAERARVLRLGDRVLRWLRADTRSRGLGPSRPGRSLRPDCVERRVDLGVGLAWL